MEHRVSDQYRKWEQRKSRIPEDIYILRSFHAEKIEYKYRGGKIVAPMIVLLLDTVYDGKNQVIPHFLQIPDQDHIGKQSRFYRAWTLAAGHPADRPRLKDMPLYVLVGKYYEGVVVFNKPLETEEVSRDIYRWEELSEPICICGHKESEHGMGVPEFECQKFILKRKTMPEELWWSKVKILLRRVVV
jgi:hypothetical protein